MQYRMPLQSLERHQPFVPLEAYWQAIRSHPSERARQLRMVPFWLWWVIVAYGAWLVLGSSVVASAYEACGLGSSAARLVGAAQIMLTGLALAIMAASILSAAYSRAFPGPGLLAIVAAPTAIHGCAVLAGSHGVHPAVALAVSHAVSFAVFACLAAAARRLPSPVRSPMWLDDPTHAERLIAECEQELLDPALTASERAAVQANLASGLAARTLGSGRYDELPRAYEILAASFDDMEPLDAYVGAARLAEAMAAKLNRTGDLDGYEDTLQLMLDAAGFSAHGLPCVIARAQLIRATHLVRLSKRDDDDGRPGRAARLLNDALDDLHGALERSSPRGTLHALARVKFASLVDPSSGDLDAAIDLCRGALRRLWLGNRLQRYLGRLVLCDLLVDRARQDPGHARRDLAEALRLCRGLQRHDACRAQAASRMPTILRLRGGGDRAVNGAYRRAFDELSKLSGGDAGDLAAEWAAWAAASATPSDAAEAHWCWARAVADDARRRPLRAEKERRLAQFLDLAGRAGEALIAAGRARDAAVALDLGRAMLLTERMHRDLDGIAERLVSAGRQDLADRWEQVREQISQADRAAFATRRAAQPTLLVRGRPFQQRFTSGDHVALAEREQLLREIAVVPGCEDVDAPADYDDLRAAATEGPIVYLVATDAGAHAVIVTDAHEPETVSLPLTGAELELRVDRLTAARDSSDVGQVTDALAETLPRLWDAVMGPVVARLAPGSLVTVVPLGRLSLLPLHAACMAPDDDGVWRDRSRGVVLRYAPNARVLRRAQSHARSLEGRPLRVLTVDAGDVPGESHLPFAELESAGVVARFGASRTERPAPATRAAVLDAMERCGIWHFACHGTYRPDDPLESSLALSDGRLKLRTLFAAPASDRRLAILSACQTAAVDEALLDEVVSFPSALLQAGVAGVISTQFRCPGRRCDAPRPALRRRARVRGSARPRARTRAGLAVRRHERRGP